MLSPQHHTLPSDLAVQAWLGLTAITSGWGDVLAWPGNADVARQAASNIEKYLDRPRKILDSHFTLNLLTLVCRNRRCEFCDNSVRNKNFPRRFKAPLGANRTFQTGENRY
jgi:hypothetical protein